MRKRFLYRKKTICRVEKRAKGSLSTENQEPWGFCRKAGTAPLQIGSRPGPEISALAVGVKTRRGKLWSYGGLTKQKNLLSKRTPAVLAE